MVILRKSHESIEDQIVDTGDGVPSRRYLVHRQLFVTTIQQQARGTGHMRPGGEVPHGVNGVTDICVHFTSVLSQKVHSTFLQCKMKQRNIFQNDASTLCTHVVERCSMVRQIAHIGIQSTFWCKRQSLWHASIKGVPQVVHDLRCLAGIPYNRSLVLRHLSTPQVGHCC